MVEATLKYLTVLLARILAGMLAAIRRASLCSRIYWWSCLLISLSARIGTYPVLWPRYIFEGARL